MDDVVYEDWKTLSCAAGSEALCGQCKCYFRRGWSRAVKRRQGGGWMVLRWEKACNTCHQGDREVGLELGCKQDGKHLTFEDARETLTNGGKE